LFDVLVDGQKVNLEFKTKNNTIEKIPWDDVVYQVEAAIKAARTGSYRN